MWSLKCQHNCYMICRTYEKVCKCDQAPFLIFMVGSLDEATSTGPMSQHIVPSDTRPNDEVVREGPEYYCFKFNLNTHCQLELECKHSKNQNYAEYKHIHNIYCNLNNSLGRIGVGVGVGVTHCSSLFPVRETNVK